MNEGDLIFRKSNIPAGLFLPPAAIIVRPGKRAVIAREIGRQENKHIILKSDFDQYYRYAEPESSPKSRGKALNVLKRQSARVIAKNKFTEYQKPSANIFVNPGGVEQRIF